MLRCASCDRENPDGAKFCNACGALLEVDERARQQRKLVTVLFCDVAGSTALGESVDAEALGAMLGRYFERMKTIVERNGGVVEKFIGDAVMAVFGVPVVHEDDALRAVRAAAEMRAALPKIGVQARIGVNSGEVVTGTKERLATGDAVNVAARLEQAAQTNEVLIGEPTLALARDAVEVEPVEPLELKGKSAPVSAYRLVRVHGAPARRHDVGFVGRHGELVLLRDALGRTQDTRRCELFTIIGEPGVGKSRLVAEFLASLEATVVRARCLPYGDGITYWPVVEVLKQLGVRPEDEAAAAAIGSLLGETTVTTSPEEIAWAFRKTLEHAAEDRPLVVVFDDIQWGEQTFLDLVEHVALLSSGAAILLLCMARSELTERRPAWPRMLRLEPLAIGEVEQLIPERISGELRAKIAHAAGGNPLFIAEMLAMDTDATDDLVVPPTLQALLAARLDQLDARERSVLERAAIEGEVFHRGAVQALASDEPQVTPRLAALVRKQLIRPEKAQLAGEDGFRFCHLLIRDSAYGAMAKASRAELHERFAHWLDERGANLVELDELVGYHLEQAARYQVELGQPDPDLVGRAGERLAAAGRRALSRGDFVAARELLRRALELTRPLRLDVHLEIDFANAHEAIPEKVAIAEAAAARACAAGDETGKALARAVVARWRLVAGGDPAEAETTAKEALRLLERASDHAGLKEAWSALGTVANLDGRFADGAHAFENALLHARLAVEHEPARGTALDFAEATRAALVSGVYEFASGLTHGPQPADDALNRLDHLASASPSPQWVLFRNLLLAMLGDLDDAWRSACEAGERFYEVTGRFGGEPILFEIALLRRDYDTAVEMLRRTCAVCEEDGDLAGLSWCAACLGRVLAIRGEYDEAERVARQGRELGVNRDFATQALWRQAQARVCAARREHAEAEELAREAVAIVERTDALNQQGDAFSDLADVLVAAGRTDEAIAGFEHALDRYRRKKNLAMVAQVRPQLSALQSGGLVRSARKRAGRV